MDTNEALLPTLIEKSERRTVIEHIEGDVRIVMRSIRQNPTPLSVHDQQTKGCISQVAGVSTAHVLPNFNLTATGAQNCLIKLLKPCGRYALDLKSIFQSALEVVVKIRSGVRRKNQDTP